MSISYSVDISPEPKHLNLEFFNDVLENALLRSNFEIQNCDFTMGTGSGENYCSQIYRVKVAYRSKNETGNDGCISLIIKSIPQTDAIDFIVNLNVFLKEKIFYNYVLPRLEVLLNDNSKFAPRLYHSLKTPVNTLVFEDLAVSNFVLGSREKGLDLAHCLLVMNKLGQFHATSKKLFEKAPELIECFKLCMLSEEALRRDEGMLMQFFSGNIAALIDVIEQWPGYEKITEKIKKYAKNFKSNLIRTGAPEDGEFKVLNHGDLWVNNMLFNYDDIGEQPLDLKFIDFQMCVWNSPGIDLNYFFYTSLDLDVLQHKLDVLIEAYYRSLSETMKELGYVKIPTCEDIRHEVKKRQLYGFFANYGVFPIVGQDKESLEDSNLENFNDEEFAKQKFKRMYTSKRMHDNFRYTLQYFDKMGIFDEF